MDEDIGPGWESMVALHKRLQRYPPTLKALFYNLEERFAADPDAALPSTLEEVRALEPPENMLACISRLAQAGHPGERISGAFWVALANGLPATATEGFLRSKARTLEGAAEPILVSAFAAEISRLMQYLATRR